MSARIGIVAAGMLLAACNTLEQTPLSKSSLGNSKDGGYREEAERVDVAAATIAGGRAPAPASPGEGGTTELALPSLGRQVFDYSRMMVIRTGHASVEVVALDKALADLQAVALRSGGFVANTQFTGGKEQQRSASLELRMPAERFDDAVSGLRGIGTLETLNVTAEDVGEEFTDITARVANARRMEQRLIELLATRTGKLADVLTVEGELARIRETIERYEGRLRFLQSRASMSRITVSLHEPVTIVSRPTGPIAIAVRQAWQNFVELVALAIGLSGVVIPVAALVGGVWWGVRTRRVARLASST
jgi:hypothetical protein